MTAAFRTEREACKRRHRRIILNNDGNEPVMLIEEPTEEELLKYRTGPLAGSQVDTVFYSTWCSGFTMFTHLTKIGQLFTAEGEWFNRNLMGALAEAGIDPLRVMNDFIREQGREFFWSLRMNDTHDSQFNQQYATEMFAANDFKRANPQYLLATPETRPRYGGWSAVNFAEPEIRDLTFRFVEEVCLNYDVDGIELDFYRHPVFFHEPARGFPCTQVERDLMTDLVRRIRLMTEDVGQRRGRPILIATRLPDSVPYCRAIGLDIERWLADDLLDLLVPAGYLRLSSWETSVDLGHRYGAMVYPALDESRVKEPGDSDVRTGTFTTPRGGDASYRARAANVWRAGADGVYLYNFFNPSSPILRQLGEPETIMAAERRYFVSVRGVGRIAGDGFPHERFLQVPTLTPQHPRQLFPGQPAVEYLKVGEDPQGSSAVVELRIWNAKIDQISATINGKLLLLKESEGDLVTACVDPGTIIPGANRIEVTLEASTPRPGLLADARVVIGDS